MVVVPQRESPVPRRRFAELIEARRRQALRLLDEGYSPNEVGRMIGSARVR